MSDLGTELATVDIEAAADPAAYVVQACERAKTWLSNALEHGDIEQIVELKSQAEAIRIYTTQKQLGKDAELSAAEIVRRAERGIGLAIRKGQEAGEFRRPKEGGTGARRDYERVRNGKKELVRASTQEAGRQPTQKSPSDFFTSGQERHEIYAMTDGVSDGEFDQTVSEAKAEGKLSRANVVRKLRAKREAQEVKQTVMGEADKAKVSAATGDRPRVIADLASQGYSSRQISERIGVRDDAVREIARQNNIDIPADVAVLRTRRIDSNRIVRETVQSLEGLAMGVGLVDVQDLDVAEVRDWAASLTESVRVLNRLIKKMKEAAQ